jgi:hypothetical protein
MSDLLERIDQMTIYAQLIFFVIIIIIINILNILILRSHDLRLSSRSSNTPIGCRMLNFSYFTLTFQANLALTLASFDRVQNQFEFFLLVVYELRN